MIIKAKYPSLHRPYMQDVQQGYGGLGTSHNNSVVTSTVTPRSLEFVNDSGETFSLRGYSRDFSSDFNSYNYIK